MDAPSFVLSFDCDTDRDAAVVEEVHARSVAAGARPAYAVPGQILERSPDPYLRVAAIGAEILNHGYVEHTRFDAASSSYVSSFSYATAPWEEVVRDVLDGHEAVLRICGVAPTGFRAPHFGELAGSARLRVLHRLLVDHGYRYSSSTTPIVGLLRGPVVVTKQGVVELPLTGIPSMPERCLDSWTFTYDPRRSVGRSDYEAALRKVIAETRRFGGVVNVYADPSQVADWDGFFDAVATARGMGISLGELAGRT